MDKIVQISESFKKACPKTAAFVEQYDTVNYRCNKCGCVVLKQPYEDNETLYECMHCQNTLHESKIHVGKPHTEEELYNLCVETLTLGLDNEKRAELIKKTERERLVQLISDSTIIHRASGDYKEVDDYIGQLVDYLLEAGVRVPPCKVGDTLWYLDKNDNVQFVRHMVDEIACLPNGEFGFRNNDFVDMMEFDTDDYFLTRDKAVEFRKEKKHEKKEN